jgi:5-(carboxyamino)imidazole ribonucleotide mutase
MADVCVIAGSKSDEKIVEKVTKVLSEEKVSYKVEYASAHREPDKVSSIVKASDAKVFIAIAGLSAALPGVVASQTKKPVIGVPVEAKLGGLDALLSIVQMPKGVPVACVGIDNGDNAAYLAKRILDAGK